MKRQKKEGCNWKTQEAASMRRRRKKFKNFTREKSNWPRLEVDQLSPLSIMIEVNLTMIDITSLHAASRDRRRNEDLRSLKTLDDLQEELKKQGFRISRSALYLRLFLRCFNTSEEKRHVSTVPVRLRRPENTLREKNPDRLFEKSFICILMICIWWYVSSIQTVRFSGV